MNTKKAVASRIQQLCKEQSISVHGIATLSGVPPMTVYSMLNGKSQNPGIVTIKKLCDGFGLTLGEFFGTSEFDGLEQEIK